MKPTRTYCGKCRMSFRTERPKWAQSDGERLRCPENGCKRIVCCGYNAHAEEDGTKALQMILWIEVAA